MIQSGTATNFVSNTGFGFIGGEANQLLLSTNSSNYNQSLNLAGAQNEKIFVRRNKQQQAHGLYSEQKQPSSFYNQGAESHEGMGVGDLSNSSTSAGGGGARNLNHDFNRTDSTFNSNIHEVSVINSPSK